MQYTLCIDEKLISTTKERQMRKIAKISTAAIVSLEIQFSDTTLSAANYTSAFEEECAVNFLHTSALNIINNTLSTNVLNPSFNVRSLRVAEMMIKNEIVQPLPMSTFMDAPVANTLGVTHIDSSGYFIFIEKKIFFMVQAASDSVRNDQNPAPLYTSAFYRHQSAL